MIWPSVPPQHTCAWSAWSSSTATRVLTDAKACMAVAMECSVDDVYVLFVADLRTQHVMQPDLAREMGRFVQSGSMRSRDGLLLLFCGLAKERQLARCLTSLTRACSCVKSLERFAQDPHG